MKKVFKKLIAVVCAAVMTVSMAVGLASCGTKNTVVYSTVALTGESYGYCVKPTDTELLNSVNDLLNEIKSNGELDKIYAMYSSEDEAVLQNAPSIGEVKTSSSDRTKELVVATNAEFAPFEYFIGNEFAGVDMQIAKLLAQKLNKTLVIMHMDFEAVITSVSTGKCDIGMAGLTISEGRAQSVTFSVAYYGTTQYVAYAKGDTEFEAVEASAAKLEDDAEKTAAFETLFKSLPAGTKAAAAAGFTGELYLKGSKDFGFEGFSNITVNSYDTVAQAVSALQGGKVRFVVGDRDTLKAAIEALSK